MPLKNSMLEVGKPVASTRPSAGLAEALLFIDERRLLPATDPPARQIHIGAGCCIETLAVGMSLHGYETDVEYLPAGPHGLEEIGRRPVARITLVPDRCARPDDLAEFISRRQTNRNPMTARS